MKHIITTIFALFAVLALSSSAAAESPFTGDRMDDHFGQMGGIGSHLFSANLMYQHNSHFHPDNDGEASSSYGIQLDVAAAFIPTLYGAELGSAFGIEAEATLGFPFSSYFGFIVLQGGPHVRLLSVGPVKLSSGIGFGYGSHIYGYVQPRASISLNAIELEASYLVVPEFASHITNVSGAGDIYQPGIGWKRLRAGLIVNFGERGDDVFGRHGLRIFIERHTFSGNAEHLAEKKIVPGEYWGGAVGYAF